MACRSIGGGLPRLAVDPPAGKGRKGSDAAHWCWVHRKPVKFRKQRAARGGVDSTYAKALSVSNIRTNWGKGRA